MNDYERVMARLERFLKVLTEMQLSLEDAKADPGLPIMNFIELNNHLGSVKSLIRFYKDIQAEFLKHFEVTDE